MKNAIRLVTLLCFCLSFLPAQSGWADEPPAWRPDGPGILDLATARQIALADNPGLAAARERIAQAQARIKAAKSSWWPSLDLNAGGSRTRLSTNGYDQAVDLAMLSGTTADRTQESYRAGLNATWVLFDGFRRKFSDEMARLDEKAGISSLENSRRLLVQAVTAAYFNAQLATSRVTIAQADTDFYQDQLSEAEARHRVGSGRLSDVLNIRVRINAARAALLTARREREAALYGLAALMGIDNARLPEHPELEPMDEDPKIGGECKVEELIALALGNRPDIREAEIRLRQLDAGLHQAKAPFYPAVVLGGGISAGPSDESSLDSDDISSTVSLNLTWNLFRGGGDRARQAELLAQKREATYRLQDLRNTIAAEVRQAVAMVSATAEQVELQRRTVELVGKNRDLTEQEYRAGQTTLTRLNEAQRDLITTRGRLAQALVGFRQAQLNLETVTGAPIQ